MQELHNKLEQFKDKKDFDSDFTKNNAYEHLTKTAVDWSKFCLESNTGKALEHGLEIARHLAEYAQEID